MKGLGAIGGQPSPGLGGFLTTYLSLPSAGALRPAWNGLHGRVAPVS